MTKYRKVTISFAMVAAGAVLAACAATANANDADVEFAQGMIPHHAQALDMAELVEGRTTNPAIVDLARHIEAAQDPEIQLMSGWLDDWDAEMPDLADADHSAMGHGAASGMMTDEQMAGLATATDDEFDLMFLELMIEHHEGAIAMSQEVLAEGANDDVKELARQIIEAQQAEVEVMRALLGEGAGGAAAAMRPGHIHGLGVWDGVLHVATHYGLYVVGGADEAAMIGEFDHDFMGFTVAEDGTFLASGHPGGGSDLSGHMGLLRSTDRGESWASVSLAGEVDFHALDAKGDMIYGYDSVSGQLMSSADGLSWERLGHVAVADVTISPDDSSVVMVTTEDGPQLSHDGGTSFEVVPGAPLLLLVDWPSTAELFGVSPDGTVHHTGDDGVTWEVRGQLGTRPQAMTVGPDGTVYAAIDDAIVQSADGGRTFSEFYRLP